MVIRINKGGKTGRSRVVRYSPAAYGIAAGIAAVFAAVVYYLALPPLNGYSVAFWWYLLFIFAVFTVSLFLVGHGLRAKREATSAYTATGKPLRNPKKDGMTPFFLRNASLVGLILVLIPLAVIIFGGIFSSTFFHARDYAGLINVEDAVFEEDMPESSTVTNIALMDTPSAVIIGNKTLGQLSDVVSQYQVGATYTQINYHGSPEKVANLEYAGFFKWINNRKNGVPGYVMVDPVNATAQYVTLPESLRYVDSAYFGEDLSRALRFRYPTKIFGSVRYELDEEGNPFYVVACLSPRVGLFGAMDVKEVILFNPVDGSSSCMKVSEAPSWIDAAYDGDLAVQKYNWYGTLSGGFWNSVIGNVDCKKTTDDYGYIAIGDDVWYYTGVTSLTSDESNIGFMLCNARTGEYKYYRVAGADESAAMGSAEGKVQNMGYIASFPALINVSGEATYVMVLKDNSGLVKNYALVNVEHYEMVATAATQNEAFSAYRNLLLSSGTVGAETTERTVLVSAVHTVTVDSEPVIYFTAADGTVCRGSLKEDESLILISAGDTVVFTVTESEIDGLYRISSYRRP